ncbi:twin-arginine translocase TatA/TatE family subunit [Rhodococcus sp. D2-41]|uniref:Sec-independent protein translocase protein TatA n=1 Tax=Speluncibacter jeojiensis TaxID=2710754 RepID=A0A9X4M826_9ACTN|nr:Sec-independent protein translocase subunit TatA [Rhodococcus sp. D2-41]MDG3011127.1 twin-arginine translocase TatA/TatE family subunit [Rhodococcus sp. D2-41]MDG3016021.1 Sec-independent protein translocase subunit TatA [Corynebacteriales bacterium D3-21]
MGALSPTHWLIIILVVVVLFGSSRLPNAARGVGRSLRIFKSEIKELHDDAPAAPKAQAAEPAPQQLPASDAPAAQPPAAAPNAQQQATPEQKSL